MVVWISDGANNRNRVTTAHFSTTATAMRLLNSQPQPRLFLLTTALNKNLIMLKINKFQLNLSIYLIVDGLVDEMVIA